MAWLDSEFKTLSSGAVHYQPWRKSTGDYDYVVEPTGDPDDDDAAIGTAVTALNSAGKGRLIIDGEVTMKTARTFTAPIWLEMRGDYSKILCDNTTAYMFLWDKGTPSAPSASYYNISATAGDEYFTTTAFTPARGDYVLLYSTDAISGVYPHNGVGTGQYPGEIHRVRRWDSGNNRAYLDSTIIDTMSTGAKAALLNSVMMDGVVVRNCRFEYTGSTQPDFSYVMLLRGVNNAVIENVHCMQDGGGAIAVSYAMNCKMNGICIDGTAKADNVYGIVAGICNGLVVSDFRLTGCRHAFDTTGSLADGSNRYGTPSRIRLSNGVVNVPTKTDGNSSFGAIHTHAEGYDITVDGVTFHMGDGASGIDTGVACTSRNVKVINCTFQAQETGSQFGGTGVSSYGPDTLVQNCSFNNLWRPCVAQYSVTAADTYCSRFRMLNNVFRNTVGPAFTAMNSGADHVFMNNHCESIGRAPVTSPFHAAACVCFYAGDGHQVIGNNMPKASNTYSVYIGDTMDETDLTVLNNVMTGYTGAGFGGTEAAAMETAFASLNNTG